MRISRDGDPAGFAAVHFIANARSDLALLIDMTSGTTAASTATLEAIAERVAQASAGPWDAYLEDEGPLGGDSMISIPGGDFEPDMYLWFDDELAPDDDVLFVAEVRQDIPRLLAQVMASRDIPRR